MGKNDIKKYFTKSEAEIVKPQMTIEAVPENKEEEIVEEIIVPEEILITEEAIVPEEIIEEKAPVEPVISFADARMRRRNG